MAGKTLKVHIFDADPDYYRVHPPVLELDGDNGTAPDKVVFRNHTTDELVLYCPGGAFTVNGLADPIPANDKLPIKTVKSQGSGNAKAFTYSVFNPKTGKKAKGNSDPVIIVEN